MKIEVGSPVKGLSIEFYHSPECPGISTSGLNLIHESPLRYFTRYIKGEEQEISKAFVEGKAFHELMLEPELFNEHYVYSDIFNGVDRRTKEGKQMYEIIMREVGPGKTILDCKEAFVKMKANCLSVEHIKNMLFSPGGESEVSLFWDEDGIVGKCRPDRIYVDKGIIVELKTTADMSTFERNAATYRYHVKAAWDCRGAEKIYKKPFQMVFVVCEKNSPYEVKTFTYKESAVDLGIRAASKDVDLYKYCTEHDTWTEQQEQLTYIDVPTWAYWEIEKN